MADIFTPEQEAHLHEIIQEAMIICASIGGGHAPFLRRRAALYFEMVDANSHELAGSSPAQQDEFYEIHAAAAHRMAKAQHPIARLEDSTVSDRQVDRDYVVHRERVSRGEGYDTARKAAAKILETRALAESDPSLCNALLDAAHAVETMPVPHD